MKMSILLVLVSLAASTLGAQADATFGNQKCGSYVAKFVKAQKEHDLEGFVSLFSEDYISFQPLGPANSFQGSATVRAHWQGLFALGLKQTGKPDFTTSVELCSQEKQADGSLRIQLTQTWQGGFDASGANPCLKLSVYMDMSVKGGRARRAAIYFDPNALGLLLGCLPPM